MEAQLLVLDGTEDTARRALGAVLAGAVRATNGRRLWSKGHSFTEADLPQLLILRGFSLPIIVPGPRDLHEDEAAIRLARAAAGTGVVLQGPSEARVRLVAAHKGLLSINTRLMQEMNALDGVSIYTLPDGCPVSEGAEVGEAKVTPLLIPSQIVEAAEQAAGEQGQEAPVRVLPFRRKRAAALIRERVSPEQARRVLEGLTKKLEWFGSTLEEVSYLPPEAPAEKVGAEMGRLLAEGAEMLLVAGGSASDPFDPLLNGLRFVPAEIERIGVPAHPGSMLWLAYAQEGTLPIVGVPSCGAFSEATTLDIVLPLLLVVDRLSSRDLAALGQGGLLDRRDLRFPRYGDQP